MRTVDQDENIFFIDVSDIFKNLTIFFLKAHISYQFTQSYIINSYSSDQPAYYWE